MIIFKSRAGLLPLMLFPIHYLLTIKPLHTKNFEIAGGMINKLKVKNKHIHAAILYFSIPLHGRITLEVSRPYNATHFLFR
jgi:hypothetical protein